MIGKREVGSRGRPIGNQQVRNELRRVWVVELTPLPDKLFRVLPGHGAPNHATARRRPRYCSALTVRIE